MKSTIQIGNAVAAPGTKAFGQMEVAMRPDGSWVSVPVAIVNGSEDGPKLWVQAGSHGEEVGGSFCVTDVVNGTDPGALKGAVIGIPVVNTPSWMASNFSTVGQRLTPTDFQNLNRVYPGNPSGSLSQQIAHCVFTQIEKWADVLIDIHDGGWSFDEAPLVIFHKTSNPTLNRRQRAMARAMLLEIVWVTTTAVPGSMGEQADACTKASELGIPSLALELSGSYNYPKGYEYSVGYRVRGIFNLMRFLGMIEGEVEEGNKQVMIVDPWFHSVRHGGFVHHKVALGEIVEKGQVLAEVRDVFNRTVVDTLVCPFDRALVAVRRAHPTVNPGDWVLNLGRIVEHEETLIR